MKSLRLRIYLFRIFGEFVLLYPLFIVMFADLGGLSAIQISTLLMVWSIAILVAEVPSGALADHYSRRNLLVLAQAIRAVGYLLWLLFPNFYGFLAGLVLWGIGHAFKSGAYEALVYDELKSLGGEKQYARIIGRGESFALFFSLGSTLAATPVFLWAGYSGIIWGSIIAVALSGIVALTLPNRPRQKSVDTPHYFELIRKAVREVTRMPSLLKLVVFGAFIGMIFRIFDEYASLIINQHGGVAVEWVPIASALVFAPVILISFVAYRFEKLRNTTFVRGLALAGGMLIIAAGLGGVMGLVFFSLFILFLKVTQIIFGAKVQHAITSETRATVTSFTGFGAEISAVGGFFIYGLMSELGGTQLALLFFGGASIAIALLYLVLARHRHSDSPSK